MQPIDQLFALSPPEPTGSSHRTTGGTGAGEECPTARGRNDFGPARPPSFTGLSFCSAASFSPTSGSGPARLSTAPDVNLLGAICLAPPLTSLRRDGIDAGQQPARRPTHRLRKGTKSCPHRRDSLPVWPARAIGRPIPGDRVIQFSCQGLWERRRRSAGMLALVPQFLQIFNDVAPLRRRYRCVRAHPPGRSWCYRAADSSLTPSVSSSGWM